MMKAKITSTVVVLVCVAFLAIPATRTAADDRDENIDVFVVLDKSLSMVEEIASVREYVRDTIVDQIIIPGDQLVLITFYGAAEILYAGDIPDDKSDAFSAVAGIVADGRFTDIGNALDVLRHTIPERETGDRRKYLLLITDGKQEAPPESSYHSTEVAFNHEFLKNAKEIRMAGWKIHILGVGTASAAKELAEKLSGTYTVVTTDTSGESDTTDSTDDGDSSDLSEKLAEATDDLLGFLKIDGPVNLRAVNAKGHSSAVFEVSSTGFETLQQVSIDGVTLELANGDSFDVSDNTVVVEFEPESVSKVTVPLSIESELPPGSYEGILTFWFDGSSAFTPGSVRVSFKVKTFLANNIWIIPVAIVVLAALAAGLLLVIRKPKSMSFLCEINDGSVRKRGYKLKFGESLYIIDGVMGFNILPKAGQTPAAKLTADSGGLHLSVTDNKQFTVPSIPGNLMGNRLEVRKRNGKKVTLSFDTN